MVCLPCIVIPFLLWVFHKFIRPWLSKIWSKPEEMVKNVENNLTCPLPRKKKNKETKELNGEINYGSSELNGEVNDGSSELNGEVNDGSSELNGEVNNGSTTETSNVHSNLGERLKSD